MKSPEKEPLTYESACNFGVKCHKAGIEEGINQGKAQQKPKECVFIDCHNDAEICFDCLKKEVINVQKAEQDKNIKIIDKYLKEQHSWKINLPRTKDINQRYWRDGFDNAIIISKEELISKIKQDKS